MDNDVLYPNVEVTLPSKSTVSVLGLVMQEMKKANVSVEKITEFYYEAIDNHNSGFLHTVQKYVTIH